MKTKNLLKKAFLLLALIGGASSAWATTKTFPLGSYTVTDGKYTVTNGATLTLGRTSGNIGGAASNSRGFRWQSNMYFQIEVPSGQQVTSVTLTSNSQGNSVNSIEFSLTDGTNGISGSWDYAPNSGKKTAYTWTVTEGMSYGAWVLTNTGSTGDIYVSQVSVTYETASTTNTPPSIVTQPTSAVTTSVGHETSLTVAASGYPAPTYQWYSCDDTEKTNASAIGGATSATYTFTPVSTGTYYYFCRATNNYESADHTADSNVSTVTVNQLYNVTYSLGDVTGTKGIVPASVEVESSLKIPSNWLLYKEGYTLTAWNDGSVNHALGSTFDVSSDVTLTPVFAPNGENAHLGYNATTVTWDFQTKNGAPTWQLEGNTGVQITQTTVGGSSIDVKLDIDATSGKLNNASWTDWAQFNEGTKLIVPVLTGAVVKLYTMNEGSGTTFGGNPADSYASNIHTYTATADGNLEVVAGSGLGYVRYISVTYPSETAVLTVSANNAIAPLTKANINDKDYLTVSTDNWATNKTYGDYTGDFYNMSTTDRVLTIKVTGASTFEAFVRNDHGSDTRTFKVKVGDAEAVVVSAAPSTLKSTGVFAIADPTVTTTITLTGGTSSSASVYPVYAVFNPTVSVTVTSAGYATYVNSDYDLDFSATSIEAYKVKVSEKGVANLTKVDNVPAGTPVLLYKDGGATEDIPVMTGAAAVSDNDLVAGTGAAVATTDGGYTNMILNNVDGIGFYYANGQTVAANRAYLHIATDLAPNPENNARMAMRFAGDITGVETVEAAAEAVQKEGKFFKDGKFFIFKNGKKYNANGQLVK